MKLTQDKLHNFTLKDGGVYSISSLENAYAFCESIALGHYENFPVGSLFIPKKQRKYVYAVYAFARIADDIADELSADTSTKLNLLEKYNELLISNTATTNPIFIAIKDMNEILEIPILPYENLIRAFSMDSDFNQPDTYNDLLYYCNFSANPVGELILRIFNIYNRETAHYSNNICTALQLVNFWQDISLDLKKNRVYIPKSVLSEYDLEVEEIFALSKDSNKEQLLLELFGKTEQLFNDGKPIINNLKPYRLKLEIAATINGGECILRKAKALGVKLFNQRPKLSKFDIIKIMINAMIL